VGDDGDLAGGFAAADLGRRDGERRRKTVRRDRDGGALNRDRAGESRGV
jgi:hypothetical protein